MKKIISACGNDCSACPRHLPKTEEELSHTAKLWLKIGYRDKLVSNDEISCTGCSTENFCRYNVIGCTIEKGIDSCAECKQYPCEKLLDCFVVTKSFAPACKKASSEKEYEALDTAFFEKKENLSQLRKEYLKTVTACGESCEKCKKKLAGLCEGCINADGYVPEWKESGRCKVHSCTREHNVQFCGLCNEFPCSKIRSLIRWNKDIFNHMEKLREEFTNDSISFEKEDL